MENLLHRPEIQSAVLPFVIALLISLSLSKLTATAWQWALLAAFAVSAVLINGLTLTPLTGTRKIILLIGAALLSAALLPRVLAHLRLQRPFTDLFCLFALVWVFGAVVARMPSTQIAMFAAGSVAFAVTLLLSFERVAANPAQLHGAGLSLLLGVGLSASAAASALLGQLALALAAASGGGFLAWVIVGAAPPRGNVKQWVVTLPYLLAPLLLGLASVMFARLPWYALIPLALIPLAVSLVPVPVKLQARFTRALLASLPGLVIALALAFWVWHSGSSASGY
jgi:hypothetical protein